jgi:hypothetical protein
MNAGDTPAASVAAVRERELRMMEVFKARKRANQMETVMSDAKDSFVSTVPGSEGASVARQVSGIMAEALRDTDSAGVDVLVFGTAAMTGVVHGAAEMGIHPEVARAIMVGALCGTQKVGRTSVASVSANAAALVKATSQVGGSVTEAAKGAVEGAVEAAGEIGMSPEGAAAAAATGALRAAGELGRSEMDQLRALLVTNISGVMSP